VEIPSQGKSDETVDKFLVQAIRIRPNPAGVNVEHPLQFTAEVVGLPDPSVKWFVEGREGGGLSTGTITPEGVYRYEGKLPNWQEGNYRADFTVTAKSLQAPYLFEEAPLTVLDLVHDPLGGSAGRLTQPAPSVSYVNRRASLETSTVFPAESVSYVNRRATLAESTVFAAQSVSYVNRRATLDSTTVFPARSVSYENETSKGEYR
jgi:hypothetical protein